MQWNMFHVSRQEVNTPLLQWWMKLVGLFLNKNTHAHTRGSLQYPDSHQRLEMCVCVWALRRAVFRLSPDNLLPWQLLSMTHFLCCFHLLNYRHWPQQENRATTCHAEIVFCVSCPAKHCYRLLSDRGRELWDLSSTQNDISFMMNSSRWVNESIWWPGVVRLQKAQ